MKQLLALLLLTTSACTTVGPNYGAPTSSDLAVPQQYYSAPAGPTPGDLQQWWQKLNDPLLNDLVEQAISGNLDLAVSHARLRQARESITQARAQGLPSVGLTGTINESIDSDGETQTSLSLGSDASWEVDLFGGIRRSVEASSAEADATGYDLATIRVSIIAEVVTNYVQARLAQQRITLANENLEFADENLQIARWRLQAGLVSSIDVEQARTQRAQIAANIPTYQKGFLGAAFRIGVLTGQAPATLVSQLEPTKPIPNAPAAVAAGIPADTLRQRPDVRAAERTLAAQTARIGVAEAELYPSLRIGGNIGTSALSLGGLLDLITGNLFASISQTIFDGGGLRSQVRSQQAATEGAYATYKQSVLTALEDVENALVAVRAAEQQQAQYTEALDAARNQALLARSEYRAGLTDFLTLLEAERSLNSASESLLATQSDRTLAVVQLYRALGGGWQPLANPQEVQ